MKALYFNEFGTSAVLCYGDLPQPTLKADEVLVKTDYIGLNFADIYRRRGNYHIEKHTPYINGYEGAGRITAAGTQQAADLIGRPVLFVDVPFANAEYVAVPLEKIIFLPETISLKLAASIGLQGLTADFLAHDLGCDLPGAKVFITGISGGVGQLLSQMLTADGMAVSGSASSEEKQQLARIQGAKKVYPSRSDNWQQTISGTFDTVYDGVGKTLPQSIELLKNRGKVIFFGMAGGNPPQLDLIDLLAHSKSLLTGDLWDYLTSSAERKKRSERLFSYVTTHKITVTEPTIFPLEQGQAAHDFLESGRSSGKVLFQP